MKLEEVLRIDVQVEKDGKSVADCGDGQAVIMVPFSGSCEGDLFSGKILPNGVDTQMLGTDGKLNLSARYVMVGKDCAGEDCWVYVENNGVIYPTEDGKYFRTVANLKTNSKALDFFNSDKFCGEAISRNSGPEIIIYRIN